MWYYSEDGRQKGPVDEEAFADLVRKGVVTPATLVWKGGMGAWQPYGTVAGGGPSSQTPLTMCGYCGKMFPAGELADFDGMRVCATCKPLFVQKYKEDAQVTGPLGLRYAGFWIRFAAHVLDGIFLSLITYAVIIPVSFLAGRSASTDPAAAILAMMGMMSVSLFQFVAAFLYTVIAVWKWGATPGKMICGLRIVRSDGSRLSFGRAAGRWGGEMLSAMICNIGYLMAAFDAKEHKTLHDTICDTRVVFK